MAGPLDEDELRRCEIPVTDRRERHPWPNSQQGAIDDPAGPSKTVYVVLGPETTPSSGLTA